MGKAKKPNILFIMTDQQRFDCVGSLGNPIINTPNIDKLAQQSANCKSCFVQAPVCVPSRQTYFSGRYPHSHKNRVNYTPLDEREILLQAHLSESGYNTSFVGKLHYYPPTREFALSTGFKDGLLHDGGPTDRHSDYVRWLESEGPRFVDHFRACETQTGKNPFTAVIPDELHETTWCGLKTREMLADMSKRDDPFFLFSSYWKPHQPFEVPEPWASMYDEAEIRVPEHVGMEYIQGLPLPLQKLILRWDTPKYNTDRETLLWMYRSYYGAISHIDREIGLTLEAVEEAGLEDNTIVVFCSDHGDLLLEHGLMGKNAFFEGAVHVPLMIRFPKTIVPGDYSDLIETTDVLSTLFELCELPVPYNNQGSSFANLITGGSKGSPYTPRKYVFSENIIPEVITNEDLDFEFEKGRGVAGIIHPDAKMVRSTEWKYNYYCGHGEELYNIKEDPGEQRNLSSDPEYAGIIREMRDALLDWLITSDESDQIAPRWGVI